MDGSGYRDGRREFLAMMMSVNLKLRLVWWQRIGFRLALIAIKIGIFSVARWILDRTCRMQINDLPPKPLRLGTLLFVRNTQS